MSVCQALTGQGGWPLSIFMTPEGNPFFAGTYFPKDRRMGGIGFIDLLQRIARLWQKDREKILQGSAELRRLLQQEAEVGPTETGLDEGILRKAYEQFQKNFDPLWGGFGRAPKFPTPHHLTFLLRWHRRSRESGAQVMVEKTLEAMRLGGIFDQIGFGFHRYSVDEKWLVPHFEKMLYDQALVAMAYTEAYQALGKRLYADTAEEIFTYVLRDMTAPEGGFYSAEDADSEGREGLFYLWTPRQVKRDLGAEMGEIFCRFYGITPEGNFEEGNSIPHVAQPLALFAAEEKKDLQELAEALKAAREQLFLARERRVRPLKDDKILTSWNGLMIAALAKGYQALGDVAYARAASRAADFLLERMRTSSGRLHRRYRHGHVAHPGFLDDYAYLTWGLLELYEATLEVSYLEGAFRLNGVMIELFADKEKGGFYFSGQENEPLISRPKEGYDGAVPSGNSVAALNLLRLARMTGDAHLEKKADLLLRLFSSFVSASPTAYSHLLSSVDFMLGPSQEIFIAGSPEEEITREMATTVQRIFLPNKILLLHPGGEAGDRLSSLSPLVVDRKPIDGQPTVYLCEGFACKTPLTDPAALKTALLQGE
jgi:uncharacterized protein YyaL (SSP411 family)